MESPSPGEETPIGGEDTPSGAEESQEPTRMANRRARVGAPQERARVGSPLGPDHLDIDHVAGGMAYAGGMPTIEETRFAEKHSTASLSETD